jgi:5-formyltetrahydrofolate cyclo-ligase
MSEVKTQLRQTAFAARKAAHAAPDREAAIATATDLLLAEIGAAEGRRISGYLPIRTEIDPRPAMVALHGAGARLAVPVIAGKGLPLDFRAWTPEARLVEGPFGAAVPEAGDWIVPEVLIVPLVGFDAAGNRLGYGGGFYDRTLEKLRRAAPTRAIGFAFDAQRLPGLPTDPTDQPLDAIVTERGVLRP